MRITYQGDLSMSGGLLSGLSGGLLSGGLDSNFKSFMVNRCSAAEQQLIMNDLKSESRHFASPVQCPPHFRVGREPKLPNPRVYPSPAPGRARAAT
jgi:hypothetical protein